MINETRKRNGIVHHRVDDLENKIRCAGYRIDVHHRVDDLESNIMKKPTRLPYCAF